MFWIELILFLAIVWGLLFFRVSLKLSTAIFGLFLLAVSFFHSTRPAAVVALWVVFLIIAIPLNVVSLRRRLLSAKILKWFRTVLPPMSETERVALEAGDVWWEGELFCGKPDWDKLLSMPKPQLTQEEKSFIEIQVETLCGLLNDWDIVQNRCDLSPEAWAYLKEQRFFGLVIDKKYDGRGFSALAHSTIVAKIASRSMSAAVNTMVPNSLGPAELIAHYGTEEQKNYYLPRLAKGIEVPCFGLTGPLAGSDAGAITDSGIVCRGEHNGKSIIGVRLNWNKRYITLAPVATLLGLAFKLYDPEHLLGDKKNLGITLCLVPTNHPGVEIGERHLPLHLAFMNGPTQGKDVFIPLDWLIGGAPMRGQGWRMLMESLAIGRGLSLPALGTAASQLSFRTAGAYARVRKQFKVSIGKFEGIQEALANIGGFTYISEAARILTASAVDQNVRPSLVSAIAKYHLTEMSRKSLNHAMDIHAGKAIQLGPKNYLALVYDALPTSITVEGANILTRNLIIFGQGAIRCHPYVRKEMAAAASDSPSSTAEFDRLLFSHIGFVLSNFVRAISYGLTGGHFITKPVNGQFAKYYAQLTRMSTALALVSDIAMAVLGGELKRKERLSARLGDVLSHLYLASAVLKYYEDEIQPPHDLPYVHWSLQWCLAQIQIAFDEFCQNFTPRWLGKVMRFIIFPWGRSYKLPSDALGHKIAQDMMHPSADRDRLTQCVYLGKDAEDGIYSMEQAFQLLTTVEPIRIKLHNAVHNGSIPRGANPPEQFAIALKTGILTPEEIELLDRATKLELEAIAVDQFKPTTLVRNSTDVRQKAE